MIKKRKRREVTKIISLTALDTSNLKMDNSNTVHSVKPIEDLNMIDVVNVIIIKGCPNCQNMLIYTKLMLRESI